MSVHSYLVRVMYANDGRPGAYHDKMWRVVAYTAEDAVTQVLLGVGKLDRIVAIGPDGPPPPSIYPDEYLKIEYWRFPY